MSSLCLQVDVIFFIYKNVKLFFFLFHSHNSVDRKAAPVCAAIRPLICKVLNTGDRLLFPQLNRNVAWTDRIPAGSQPTCRYSSSVKGGWCGNAGQILTYSLTLQLIGRCTDKPCICERHAQHTVQEVPGNPHCQQWAGYLINLLSLYSIVGQYIWLWNTSH